jgi:hypothetical protein
MSVSYGGDSITFGDGTIVSSGSQGFKNKIINGDFRIDQRNAGASKTYSAAEAVYNVDRWQAGAIGGGTFTTRQMDSANTSASNYEASSSPTGFVNSLKITVGTVDTSLASSDRYSIYQYIEGYNVQDLDFGISTAKSVTVSFWTKSSVVGTYGVWLSNGAYSRSAVNTFTINVANTWEYKTLTFVGDTTGSWIKDNGPGLHLGIQLSAGSGYQTSSTNTWAATAYFTTSGQTNFMATTGNTFYITGVQLEKGSTASSYEFRSYGKELLLCMRYYQPMPQWQWYIYNINGAGTLGSMTLPVPMRLTPTVVAGTYTNVQGATSMSVSCQDNRGFNCYATATISNTIVWTHSVADGSFSAEL